MISISEYQERRQRLAQMLPQGSVAVIPSANESLRNGDAHYRFRQDSDFYYLTGFNEPEAVLLILADTGQSVLYNRPRNFSEEQWTGKRLGQDGAREQLGVDTALSIECLEADLARWFADKTSVYYPIGRSSVWDKCFLTTWNTVKKQVRRGIGVPQIFGDVSPFIGEMRLFKSVAELELMREAARISVAAHQRAMRVVRQSHFEYELEAEIRYELIREGCRSVAYDSIVAAGNNACILHYTENNKALHAGDLVLIDAGGEFQNYAADITRTFPINGRFSSEQQAIYELVLKAQKAGMSLIRPGCVWDDIQQAIVRVLTKGLLDLGLLKGTLEDLILSEAYRPFYMHRSGHWLGLDVHDVGCYKIDGQWRVLEPGMVLTVEPGLYIHNNIPNIDSRWYGIGVRIEDDIHVTETGYENLTAALAVEISEIEALICG